MIKAFIVTVDYNHKFSISIYLKYAKCLLLMDILGCHAGNAF